jgi:hypothetical protein
LKRKTDLFMMCSMKQPSPSQPPADTTPGADITSKAAKTLRQIQALQELTEIGMVLLRRLAQRPPDSDVVRSFETMSQAVRQTIALEDWLDGGLRAEAVARAAERAQVMRELSRAAERIPKPAEPDPQPVIAVKPRTGRILN